MNIHSKPIRIATRQSPLALWQTQFVVDQLKKLHPEQSFVLIPMKTEGDKKFTSKIPQESGKGLFTKELEIAMLKHKADIAVHSVKDLSTELPSGLKLAIICKREDPRDAYISFRYPSLNMCPPGARIGTGSLRRQSQLKFHYPHLTFVTLQGNVGTRLLKLKKGICDVLILAYAGIKRLGIENHTPIELISLDTLLSAPGQGAIGIECRNDDIQTQTFLNPLHDPKSACSIFAERSLSQHLGGGCQVPLAALAFFENDYLCLKGRVGSINGQTLLQAEKKIKVKDFHFTTEAIQLGIDVAEDLIQQGARALLCQQ